MFNLYEILRNAQAGKAIENLASQFNLSPEQADAAVKAVAPELSERLLKNLSEPRALAPLMAALGTGQHLAAFESPAGAQAAAQAGSGALSEILSPAVQEAIAGRASAASGIPLETLSQIFPAIASIIFGGLTKSLENQGFGGLLGQVSEAFGQGNLGSVLGHILGGGPVPPSPGPRPAQEPSETGEAGGLAGLMALALGILKRFAGASSGSPAGPSAAAPSLDAGALQEGLEALKKILRPGTPPPPVEVPPAEVRAPPAETRPPQAPLAEAPPGPAHEAHMPPPASEDLDIGSELDRIAGKERS